MFKKFFRNRIQKDISKLEEARKRCITVMHSKGLSENEMTQVDEIAHKKASIEYMNSPNIQKTLQVYFKSLQEEALKKGYDIS